MDIIEKVNESVNELEKESDRACIILAASIIDDALYKLLDHYLVPYPGSNDPVFSTNGPLSTFSNKINLAYRLGLISNKMSKTIHWIRKIRNVAAHEYQTISFGNQKIKDISNNIFDSTKLVKAIVNKTSSVALSERKKFVYSCSYLIFYFNQLLDEIPTLEDRELEWGLKKESMKWYNENQDSKPTKDN